jgi:hypothetical protein
MKKLSASTLITAVALTAGFTFAAPAGAADIVDQPRPLKTRVVTKDGKKKIKIGKKLPVLVSCSKDCRFKATVTLVAPAVSETKSLKGRLVANNILTLNYKLTNFGRRYLKSNVRKSKLKVKFAATDVATGKRYVKKRVFKFRR